jgi:hypothetical protein
VPNLPPVIANEEIEPVNTTGVPIDVTGVWLDNITGQVPQTFGAYIDVWNTHIYNGNPQTSQMDQTEFATNDSAYWVPLTTFDNCLVIESFSTAFGFDIAGFTTATAITPPSVSVSPQVEPQKKPAPPEKCPSSTPGQPCT